MDTNTNDAFNQLFGAYIKKVGPSLAMSKMIKAGNSSSLLYINGFNFVYWSNQISGKKPVQYQALANGVTQLAGVSHIGPALASLVEIFHDDPTNTQQWQSNLSTLLSGVIVAEKANSPDYWLSIDPIVFYTYADDLSKMITSGLLMVKEYLLKAIEKPKKYLNYDALVENVLNPQNAPYPFDNIMIATFSLANLLVQYHSISWLRGLQIDWKSCSVLIGGQAGRATGGLSVNTNTGVQRLIVASEGILQESKILIAPMAPSLDPTQNDLAYWNGIKKKVQSTWWLTDSSSKLSPKMFKEYESIIPESPQRLPPFFGEEKPPMNQFMQRLKFALGNPDQELASCTANFMVESLGGKNFNPNNLYIPGLRPFST